MKGLDCVQRQSTPSNQNDWANPCWQRSVKRKYDDGFQETTHWSGCSPELAERSVPSNGYCEKASCSPREVSMLTIDMEFDDELNEGYSLWLSSSDMHVAIPCPQEETFELSSSMVNVQDVLNTDFERYGKAESIATRRVGLGNFRREPQTFFRVNPLQDIASQSEVFQLREALKSQKKALHSLYIELEKERCASATAANEAMAMITRLQEEKAAAFMEARQYKRMTEEKESHHQEAIASLRQTILDKEDDLLALQDQIEAYSKMFYRIELGTQGWRRGQGNLLEEGLEKQGLLFLDGQEATSSSSLCGLQCQSQNQVSKNANTVINQLGGEWEFKFQNQELSSPKCNYSSKLAASGCTRMNLMSFYDDLGGGCTDWATEDDCSLRGWMTGEGTLINSPKRNHCCDEDRYWDGQRFEAAEITGVNMQEQNLEDTTVSILARVKRLEERLQYLGRTQPPEIRRFSSNADAVQNDDVVNCDLSTENVASTSWNSAAEALHNKCQLHAQEMQENQTSSTSERLVKNWGNGYQKECLLVPNGEADAEAQTSESKINRPDMHKSPSRQEDGCTESWGNQGEGVHDVYEVHYETDESFVRHPEYDVRDLGQCMNQLEEKEDVLFSSTLQKYEREHIEDIPARTSKDTLAQYEHKGCREGINEKLSVETNSLEGKDAFKSMADEEVHQLKLRLQALEAERVFMKQAIESLREENMELKLLQEIAQQLRELKGDAQNTNQPKGMLQQDQPSFFSFFKDILSFTGLQSSVHTEKSRFVCLLTASNKQNHGGLVHLLEKPPQSRKVTCVMRGLKVRLPAAGETGHLNTHNSSVQLHPLYR